MSSRETGADFEPGNHRPESSASACIYCIARIGCDTADTHRYGLLSEPIQQPFDGGGLAAFEFEEAVTPGRAVILPSDCKWLSLYVARKQQ